MLQLKDLGGRRGRKSKVEGRRRRRTYRPDRVPDRVGAGGAGADHRERRVRRTGEIPRRGGFWCGRAGVESRIHDPWYRKLFVLSIPNIVLVFDKKAQRFEGVRKRKKTQG